MNFAHATLDCGLDVPVTLRGLPDTDADGVSNAVDNCLNVANASQMDTDRDGFGNACDQDLNNDGIVNFLDLVAFESVFLSSNPDADFNGDGLVNFLDYTYFTDAFLAPPGPRGQCLNDPAYCTGPVDIGVDDAAFGDEPGEAVAVIRSVDQEDIWHARRIVAGLTQCNRAVSVSVFFGAEPFNPGWSWYPTGPIDFHGSNVLAIDQCNLRAVEVEAFVQQTQCGLAPLPGSSFCLNWCTRNSRIVSVTDVSVEF